MGRLTLKNNSGQDIQLTLPNNVRETFKNGETKTKSEYGTYYVSNVNIMMVVIEYLRGTLTFTVDATNLDLEVSVLYLQVGFRPVNLSIIHIHRYLFTGIRNARSRIRNCSCSASFHTQFSESR